MCLPSINKVDYYYYYNLNRYRHISVKNLAAILGIDSENVSTLLSTLNEVVNNKDVKNYTCLFTEFSNTANTDSENKVRGNQRSQEHK